MGGKCITTLVALEDLRIVDGKRELLPRHSTLSLRLQGLQPGQVNDATTRLHRFIGVCRVRDLLSPLVSVCFINDRDNKSNVVRLLTLFNEDMSLCAFKFTARRVWHDNAQ